MPDESVFDGWGEVHMFSNTERLYKGKDNLLVANQAIDMAGSAYFKRRLLFDKPHCRPCVLIRLYAFAGKPTASHLDKGNGSLSGVLTPFWVALG